MYLCVTSCICVLEISILPLSNILIFDCGIVPTVLYFMIIILSHATIKPCLHVRVTSNVAIYVEHLHV